MNAKRSWTKGLRGLIALGLGGVMLTGAACGGSSEASVTSAAPAGLAEVQQRATVAPLGKTIWLRAGTNGKIVSADRNINGNAPLVANRDAAQGWEKFVVGSAGGDYITLRVQETGAYVSADPNAAGELTGFRTAVGEWEQFLWVDFGNGTIGLKAKSTGKFVVTDTNRGAQAPLFADRATAGQWESFSWGADGGGTTPPPSGSGWVQVWGDEFDGTSINTSNWAHNTTVHVNNEQQQYTTSNQNISVSNGTLKLTARKQATNGYPFSSGRLESAGKRQFGHTRVEARIKMPVGPGLWPAFWMLGKASAAALRTSLATPATLAAACATAVIESISAQAGGRARAVAATPPATSPPPRGRATRGRRCGVALSR